MAQSYTRQSSIADGDTITAALFNNEYNQLLNAFAYSSSSASSTGHRHDGTAAQGGNIPKIGDLDFLNKIEVDSTNNRWGVYVEVSSAAVEQVRISDGVVSPVTDSDVDLGTSSLYFKNAYIDAITTTGNVAVGGNLTVTGTTAFNGGTLTLGDSASDNVVFGADINSNMIPNTDSAYDLGSSSQEWRDLYLDGTAHIDTLDVDVNATVAGTLGVTGAFTGSSLDISGDVTVGDDLSLDSDAAVLGFGADTDVTLTHVADTGLLLNSTMALQFNDASQYINAPSATVLDINATDEIELNATLVDINANVDISGTLTVAGALDFGDAALSNVGDIQLDSISGDTDSNTSITFSGSDVITVTAGGETQVTFNNGSIVPTTDNDVDLGTSSLEFKDGYFDGTVYADAINFNGTAISATAAELNIMDGVTATAADINLIDGITNGTVIASKAIITDANKDITGGRNITISGELDAGSLDISGDADIDGTLETDALSINGTAVTSTAAELNILDGVTASATDINLIDGITNGTVIASKAIITDSNKDITGGRNITISGELDAATLDISGDVDVDGTLEADAITVNGTALASVIAGTTVNTATLATTVTITDNENTNENNAIIFTAGGDLDGGNVGLESDGDLFYNPSTSTLTVPNVSVSGTFSTVNSVTMNANNAVVFEGATADAHETTLSSIDATGDRTINLPNVSGTLPVLAAVSATAITSTPAELNILDGATVVVGEINALDLGATAVGTAIASKAVILDSNKDYTGIRNFTLSGELDAGSLDVSGDADIDGTLETDALSINGTAVTSTAAELNILDGVTSTAAELNILDGVTSTAAEINLLDGSAANTVVNSKGVIYGSSGEVAGTLSTAAQANITSLGTLTALTGGTGDFNWDSNTLVVDSSTNRVGIGNASPDVSLDIGSFTDAMHLPVGTTAQRPTGAAGYFRYNSTTGKFEGFTDEWGSIGGGSGTNMDTNIYAGDGSDTTFTLSNAPDDENNLMVFIDGVFQAQNTYSVSGTTLTFATAPANGRVITVYHSTTTVGGSNNTINTMTGDGSDTTLTLSVAPVHENNVQVFFDGVYQSKANYAISGTTLTFSTAPPDDVLVEAITNTNTSSTTANLLLDADKDTMIQVEESSDEDTIRMDIAGTEVLTLTNSAMTLKGTTPTLTIGDAGAEDTKIVFDGNAQDYYIGLDDSADDLIIGKGSAVGTTPAIVIDENLKVGINFATPTAKLSLPAQASGDSGIARFAIESAVDSNDFTIAQYEDGTGTYTQIGQNISLNSGGNVAVLDSAHKTAGITFDGRSNGSLMFQTGAANANAERMRLTSAGDLYFAQTSGSVADVGTILQANGRNFFMASTTSEAIMHTYNNTSNSGAKYIISFRQNNTEVGSIEVGSSSTALVGSSDYRLKENVEYNWDATTRLKQLKPCRFNWIADDTNTLIEGFLAHEVTSIVPEAVRGEKDAVYTAEEEANELGTEGAPKLQGIDQSKLIPLLVKTIQELEARIKTLEDA